MFHAQEAIECENANVHLAHSSWESLWPVRNLAQAVSLHAGGGHCNTAASCRASIMRVTERRD